MKIEALAEALAFQEEKKEKKKKRKRKDKLCKQQKAPHIN